MSQRADMIAALKSARRLLIQERFEQASCFVVGGAAALRHMTDTEALAVMSPVERAAIRRFDRVIGKINAALGTLR